MAESADTRLAGKVVIISGGGGGIGSADCRAFAAAGARVVAADHLSDRAEAAARSVRDAGREALAVRTDVTSDDSVAAAIAATLARFGRLDVLYNCAGGTDPASRSISRRRRRSSPPMLRG